MTVLRALRTVLPQERFVYLGDTARLPYGTKSAASVVRYSLQCADALVARGIRCLVVACNTASASALDALAAAVAAAVRRGLPPAANPSGSRRMGPCALRG